MNRIFDPGPKTYSHLIERLSRRIDLKYRVFEWEAEGVFASRQY